MTSTEQRNTYHLVVVAPVFDDATAAVQLCQELNAAFSSSEVALTILLVDDGSPVSLASQIHRSATGEIHILRLRRNVGHQRAIALGIAYVHDHLPGDAVLVMDADGEDRPADAVSLVGRCRERAGDRVIFAERTRRSESSLFQLFYRFYQLLHWLLTGIRVRVGNFSVVPAACLPALVTLPALWNHFAAAIFQARLPRELVPTARGVRYSGCSKMNFTGLVIHGLQAISVFIDVVAVRLMFVACLMAGVSVMGLALTLLDRWGWSALPGWAVLAAGAVMALTSCLAVACFSLALGFLSQRNRLDFVPVRDYRLFVGTVCRLTADGKELEIPAARTQRREVVRETLEPRLQP